MNLYISSSSSMKKFLRNLVIYLSLVIAITLGLNALYKPKSDDIGAFANGVPDNIQICREQSRVIRLQL